MPEDPFRIRALRCYVRIVLTCVASYCGAAMTLGIPLVNYSPLPLPDLPSLAVALSECRYLEEVNMKFCHYVTSGGLRIIVNNRGASLRGLVSVTKAQLSLV